MRKFLAKNHDSLSLEAAPWRLSRTGKPGKPGERTRHPTALEASLRCSKPRPCKQQANALQVDGPEATVRKAWPVTVTPVGLLAMRCMGLWPSSAMVVAPELLERKWHWMGTRSTQTMIAICSPFRRHRKEAHEEKAEDHYHGSQARYFQTLCKKKSGTCRHRATLEDKTMQQMVFCQFAMEVMVFCQFAADITPGPVITPRPGSGTCKDCS